MDAAVEQERSFLARFPKYATVLESARESEFVRERLKRGAIHTEPFPYLWVEEIMSPELYELVDAAWPHIDWFPAEERHNRRDLVPRPPGITPKDKRASTYDDLPVPIRAVWDFFVIEINRAVVGPWLADVFKPAIDERLMLIERARRSGRATKDYYTPPYVPKMNVGRLMMRADGFRLRPHADALAYLATALYYFPGENESADLGTTLYHTERGIDEDAIIEEGRTVYFADAGITATPAFSAPFRRNSLLAFANCSRSAHGMEITTPGVWRRAYQSHLSIKSDRHHL